MAVGASILLLGVGLAACGKSGSSSSSSGKGCTPEKGNDLVVLADDKHLQLADNVLPAVNTAAASPTLIANLDKVSDALTTSDLVKMNTQTDIDRKTPEEAATAFVRSKHLTDGVTKGSGSLTIGIVTFNEVQSVANVYKQVLSAAGYDVKLTTPIQNRESYLPDLESNKIQVVPEYAATLTEFINHKQNGPNAAAKATTDVDSTVSALTDLGSKVNLKFGKPSKAVDTNAFAVTKKFATKNKVKSLSDVASKCNGGKLVLGGVTECKNRPFCQPGLEKTYGIKFTQFKGYGENFQLIKSATRQGQVQMGLVLSSDAGLGTP
ncbi:MAG: glycine betaine ABC transporter substrate-binding protein [Mycobacteriales bacterium]